MFIKFCNTKFDRLTYPQVKEKYPEFCKRVASKSIPIDPESFLYIQNESVHCDEFYGSNENGDGFPLSELKSRYHTFLGARSSVDHKDELIIGEIMDTLFIEPIFTASGQNQEKQFSGGGLIENLIGIEFEKVSNLRKQGILKPDVCQLILDGKITDTSMGALVERTECSICGHIAYEPEEYCEHILGGKNRNVKLADGSEKNCYERCYGVTWFEEAIIIPLELGGLAGGQGADISAKIKNIITQSVDWEGKLQDLYKSIIRNCSKQEIKTFEDLVNLIGN